MHREGPVRDVVAAFHDGNWSERREIATRVAIGLDAAGQPCWFARAPHLGQLRNSGRLFLDTPCGLSGRVTAADSPTGIVRGDLVGLGTLRGGCADFDLHFAFHRAIAAAPSDDAPAQIYADYLHEECDEADLANLYRRTCNRCVTILAEGLDGLLCFVIALLRPRVDVINRELRWYLQEQLAVSGRQGAAHAAAVNWAARNRVVYSPETKVGRRVPDQAELTGFPNIELARARGAARSEYDDCVLGLAPRYRLGQRPDPNLPRSPLKEPMRIKRHLIVDRSDLVGCEVHHRSDGVELTQHEVPRLAPRHRVIILDSRRRVVADSRYQEIMFVEDGFGFLLGVDRVVILGHSIVGGP